MNKEIYHGTTFRRIGNFCDGVEDLFGVRYIHSPALSATLTDDKGYAMNCAFGASMNDGWGHPGVVIFSLPEEILVPEGPIHGSETTFGFSTTLRVKPRSLPEGFLKNIGLTVEDAIKKFANKEVEFYRIPYKYKKSIDVLD